MLEQRVGNGGSYVKRELQLHNVRYGLEKEDIFNSEGCEITGACVWWTNVTDHG